MKKIKIAQFVGAMNCGGAETMIMNLYKQLDKDKYEFVFIENVPNKTWYNDEIESMGGRIVKIQPFSIKYIKSYVNELIELFRKEKFSVVHSHVFLHSGIIMYAAKKAGIKSRIAHSHSAMGKKDNNFFKTFILRKMILKYSNKLVACSTEAGYSLFGKSFSNKGIVMPNPIPLDKIKNVSIKEINELKTKYKIAEDELVIGHVGRLVEVKNHKFMIELATYLKQINVPFKMFFLGDGPLKESIQKEIRERNLHDNVIMTGNVTNVYTYMRVFNILLMPSFYEGLPLTLIEAQASGLYSIVSDRVSRESDLGLNLMEFCSINEQKVWIDSILKKHNVDVSKEKIYETIKEKKYDSSVSKLEYEKIYD